MIRIPRLALFLGLAGVLPFALPAIALSFGIAAPFGLTWLGVQSLYALTILSFMSGCLWGFAAKAEDGRGYTLSTLPALLGFFLVLLVLPFSNGAAQAVNLAFCLLFPALLLLDLRAAKAGQTPPWWMQLRLLLTTLVVASLLAGAFV